MRDTYLRFAQALLSLSLVITAIRLSTESGGEYLFTLIALVLWATALPYLVALSAIRRMGDRWALAVGVATCTFGAVDVAVRMRAFYFASATFDGGMAFWLPIYGALGIPALAVITHTFLTAFGVAPRK